MYAIARIAKYCRADVNGISIERNREKCDGRNYARSDIDKTITDQNITLIDCKHFNNEISRKIKNADVKERPDSIVLLGGLYTASREFFTLNDKYIELSPEDRKAVELGEMEDPRSPDQRCRYLHDEKAASFFAECLQFHIDTYCQGDASRVISAKIDYDETTPHLQVYSVPLQERTNKKGITKMHLCAKQLVGNRVDLRRQQDQFFERVGQPRGFERGEKVDWDIPFEERKKHEETYAHKQAEQKALIASQEAQIASNASIIQSQEKAAQEAQQAAQNELERSRLQLIKQAEAAEALAKSKIKKNGSLFHKDEELPYKMNMKDYQNATGQTAAVNRLLDSPVYTPQERKEMEREAAAARSARNAYEKQSQDLDKIVEERVQERIELLRLTEPRRIEQLEEKLTRKQNDLDYVVDAIKRCLIDHGISIEDFERVYNVQLSDLSIDERTH